MHELSHDLSSFPGVPASVVAGHYEARLANSPQEVLQAQKLRYQVMYAEKGGHPDLHKVKNKADIDQWDECAHHIVVVDNKVKPSKVVGTLRLVSNLSLAEGQSFYTEEAFDLSALRDHYPSMLELGRFCIDPSGRNGAILMLIWKYAMQFIVTNKVDVMFGCASFPGTNIDEHRDVLTYLSNNNLAPEELMPIPVIDHVKLADIATKEVDFDDATKGIPTLLRGYLKLGAKTSDTAIIDPVFNTTFICIYVDAKSMLSENTSLVTAR